MKHLKLVINNENKKKDIFFNKGELRLILNLYAKMVSNGEWKDYGLSISKKEVSFNVYQRDGLSCKRISCNDKIKKKIITNRSTFFCNSCQK